MNTNHKPIFKFMNLGYPLTVFGAGSFFCFYRLVTGYNEMETWRLVCFATGGGILFSSLVFLLVFIIRNQKNKAARS